MPPKGKRLNVLMDNDLYKKVEDRAKEQDVPMAHIARTAIRQLVGQRPEVKQVGE